MGEVKSEDREAEDVGIDVPAEVGPSAVVVWVVSVAKVVEESVPAAVDEGVGVEDMGLVGQKRAFVRDRERAGWSKGGRTVDSKMRVERKESRRRE